MTADVYDDRLCELGEGPLWHPGRQTLFWFDILGKRMLARGPDGPQDWLFDRHVSAAGWVDNDTLLVATETDLSRFDLTSGTLTPIVPLEADIAATRSNDGRADPFGGFWIGTMGKAAESGMARIHRYYKGELREIIAGITIPNAICFDADAACAYFADTATGQVWRQALDPQGWPDGDRQVFIDHGPSGGPDGAVVDSAGHLWNAHWGHSKVSVYDRSGQHVADHALPCRQPSCPAFGGADLDQLFVTSAREHMGDDAGPADGLTYRLPVSARGVPEPRVIL